MNFLKTLLQLLFCTLVIHGSFGQDKPVPKYLVNQNLPDSVMLLNIYTLNGEETTFSEIINKNLGSKVVVDFWASWCRDCIHGLPKLNSLINKTKGSEVKFVMLSVDKEEKKWKSAIDRFEIKGEHYRFQSGWINALTNYINLDWIPRYLVIDEKGNVSHPKSIHADDPNLLESLK